MKKLYALRGASQCENNIDDMGRQIALMYDELLAQNSLEEKDIVSCMFTVTSDLKAANPCASLRKSGRARETALFASLEPDTEGSLERTVRILIHCYLEEGIKTRHVYRNGTEVLRPDRVISSEQ